MARLWSSGFELNTTTKEGFDVSGNTTPVIDTIIVRSGTYSLKHSFSSTFSSLAQYQFASAEQNVLFARVYFYATNNPSVILNNLLFFFSSLHNGQIYAKLNTDGTFGLFYWNGSAESQIGSTSTSSLSLSTWNRLELGINMTTLSSTTVTLKLEGITICSGTVNFSVTGQTGMNKLQWGPSASASTSYTIYSDDIAINDSTGSFQKSYPGSEKLILVSPNGAGSVNTWATQVGGTAGSANNYTRVNEIPPDDVTSYNGSSTSNQEDFYTVATNSGIGATDTINVVHVGYRLRSEGASGFSSFTPEIKKSSAGTVFSGTLTTPQSGTTWITNVNVAPTTYPITLYQDPDNTNWTKANLDTTQIGMKMTNPGAQITDVSNVWMYIGYTPATGPAVTGPFPTHLRV